MNKRNVEDLIRLVEDSEIHELTVEGLFTTVRIVKGVTRLPEGEAVHFAPAARAAAAPAETDVAADPIENDSGLAPIVSPMVGTFYVAASPDAAPYVKQGDHVNKGQVVCLVEAMKLMNEIESDISGTVARAVAENAQPVEYGQVLFLVQPDQG